MNLIFAGQSQEGTPESRATASFTESSDTRHKWIGAFDQRPGANDTLIAVAHWYFIDDPSIEHFPHGAQGWSPGTNVALGEAHLGRIREHRLQRMLGKRYAYLCLLVVEPEWQRRGLGCLLLEHTLGEIDALGWEAWIEATPAGTGLYERLGWEVVDVVRTDLREWGGTGVEEDAEMIRLPRKVMDEVVMQS